METTSDHPANLSFLQLVYTSLAVDYWLGNVLLPFYYHLSTFFWYLVQLVLMFALSRKCFDHTGAHPGNVWLALFATALYGVHPVIAETVNYVSQRADLYSTLGDIAGLVRVDLSAPAGGNTVLYLLPVAAADPFQGARGRLPCPAVFLHLAY